VSNLKASLHFNFQYYLIIITQRNGNSVLIPTASIDSLSCDAMERGTWNIPEASGFTKFNSERTFARKERANIERNKGEQETKGKRTRKKIGKRWIFRSGNIRVQ
jgi:hypothetical protein